MGSGLLLWCHFICSAVCYTKSDQKAPGLIFYEFIDKPNSPGKLQTTPNSTSTFWKL